MSRANITPLQIMIRWNSWKVWRRCLLPPLAVLGHSRCQGDANDSGNNCQKNSNGLHAASFDS